MLNENGQPTAAGRRLERAAAAAALAVWDLDLTTGVFTTTSRFNDLLGRPRAAPQSFAALVEATLPADRFWVDDLKAAQGAAAVIGLTRTYRFRIRAGGGETRWLMMKVDVGYGRTDGVPAPTSYTGVLEDITGERATALALAESEERLKLAIEAGQMAVWEVELESGALTNSPELNLLLGFPRDAVITLEDVRGLYLPGELDRIEREGVRWEAVKARAARGESPSPKASQGVPEAGRMQIQAEVAILTPAGERKDLLLRAQHAPSLRGKGERVTGLMIDITERKRSEERLAVVARELQHRVKNSLAVVQTLAVQSFRGRSDGEQATQAFLGRLRALAVATGMILDGGTGDAGLSQVVEAITRPYRMGPDDPFVIAGPQAMLTGKAATAIGMALHELCTNAVKYGALSAPAGRVCLDWRIGDGRLVLDWIEEGGPAVVVPVRRGFGSKLLDTVLGEHGGGVEMNYEPFGLKCRLTLAVLEA